MITPRPDHSGPDVNLEGVAVHEESALVKLLDEHGNDLEQIADDAVVGDLAGLPR